MKKILFICVLVSLLAAGCLIAPPSIVNFTVNPSTITAGQLATLTWTVNNASTVKIDPFSGNQYSSGSTVVSPASSTTYVLIASNAGGSKTATALLTVNPQAEISPHEEVSPSGNAPVVQAFTVNPSIIVAGASATLQWDVTSAISVFIEPNIGYVPLSGSQLVSPEYSTSYVLTASNANNTVTSSVTLSVNSPPTYTPPYALPNPSSSLGVLPMVNFFDINPPVINSSSSTTIQWNVTNADTVFIDHGIGNVAELGTRTITPSATTVYTLTAVNIYGSVTSSAIAVVNPAAGAPVVHTFLASPSTITAGSSTALQWNVTGATSVSINQGIGSVPLSGTKTVSPSITTIYTLTATNSSGSVSISTTINVTPSAGLPVIVNFAASPDSVNVGYSSMLQWNVTGATSATLNQGIGVLPISGTRLVSPISSTVYILTATNSVGSITAPVTVNVVGVSAKPLILRFSVYPTSIQPADWAELKWQVAGATSISIDQGVGAIAPSGELKISPAATRTYTLTATNNDGSVTASVTLTVIPETGQPFIDSFSASPAVIELGESSTLEWEVIGATSVTITPGLGPVPLKGARMVSPNEATIYVLRATNNVGVTTHTAQVTVTFEPK